MKPNVDLTDHPQRLLTALAGLYAHLSKALSEESDREMIKPCRDSILDCLSEMWTWSESARKTDLRTKNKNKLQYIGDVAGRLEKSHGEINFWTATWRVLRLIIQAEQRWNKSVQILLKTEHMPEVLQILEKSSTARIEVTKKLFDKNFALKADQDHSYAEPQSMLG